MSEDAKKILDSEKMSEDELDNVAGGNKALTFEILDGMMAFDSKGVSRVLETAATCPELADRLIETGTRELLHRHFGDKFQSMGLDENDTMYFLNGKTLSHDDVMKMISDKANAAKGFEIL